VGVGGAVLVDVAIPGLGVEMSMAARAQRAAFEPATNVASDALSAVASGARRVPHSRYADDLLVFKDQRPPRLVPGPDPAATSAHTRLRWDEANGRIYQGREFDDLGHPVRDVDFTSPTYPNGGIRADHAPAPHQHRYEINDPRVGPKSGHRRSDKGAPL
jgi:hypothetical protein